MAQYVHSHKLRLADGRSATSTEQGATNIPPPSTPALILAKVSTQNFWLGLVVKLG